MRHMPFAAARQRRPGEDGQSLMEFAFLLPVLCLLAVGVVELGRAAAFTIAANNAATAGVEYGSQNETTAVNITQMQLHATEDANFGFGTITATATYGCLCDPGTGASCSYPVPGPGTCNYETLGCAGQIVQCVQVTTQATWHSMLNYPGIPSMYQANGQAVMRVRR
jgi:Flp pilus assembly protein TadG